MWPSPTLLLGRCLPELPNTPDAPRRSSRPPGAPPRRLPLRNPSRSLLILVLSLLLGTPLALQWPATGRALAAEQSAKSLKPPEAPNPPSTGRKLAAAAAPQPPKPPKAPKPPKPPKAPKPPPPGAAVAAAVAAAAPGPGPAPAPVSAPSPPPSPPRVLLTAQEFGNFTTSCDNSTVPAPTIRECCSESSFAGNDDGSVAVTFPFPIAFFAPPATNWFLNNNGNIAPQQFGTYTPFPLIGHGSPVIAAFLADVDTRGAQTVGNVVTYGAGVCTTGPPETHVTYLNRTCWCANWVFSDFYCGGSTGACQTSPVRLNSFQLCLIEASSITGVSGDVDIEFNYVRPPTWSGGGSNSWPASPLVPGDPLRGAISWDEGTASGGTSQGQCSATTDECSSVTSCSKGPARVGLTDGNTVGYEVPGSGKCGALQDNSTMFPLMFCTNCAIPGRLLFTIRTGKPPPPTPSPPPSPLPSPPPPSPSPSPPPPPSPSPAPPPSPPPPPSPSPPPPPSPLPPSPPPSPGPPPPSPGPLPLIAADMFPKAAVLMAALAFIFALSCLLVWTMTIRRRQQPTPKEEPPDEPAFSPVQQRWVPHLAPEKPPDHFWWFDRSE